VALNVTNSTLGLPTSVKKALIDADKPSKPLKAGIRIAMLGEFELKATA
jgi:hypothetical protein